MVPVLNRETKLFRFEPFPCGQDYRIEMTVPAGWFVDWARARQWDVLERQRYCAGEFADPKIPNDTITMMQGGASQKGWVVDQKYLPLGGGRVCAVAMDEVYRRQPGGAFCVMTSQDGSFKTDWMSPGAWQILAFRDRPPIKPDSPSFANLFGKSAIRVDVPRSGGLRPIRLFPVN
jgi:hypothetical protein